MRACHSTSRRLASGTAGVQSKLSTDRASSYGSCRAAPIAYTKIQTGRCFRCSVQPHPLCRTNVSCMYSACCFPFGCNSTAAQHSTAEMDFGPQGFVSHRCLCALHCHAMRCTPAAYGVCRIMRPLCPWVVICEPHLELWRSCPYREQGPTRMLRPIYMCPLPLNQASNAPAPAQRYSRHWPRGNSRVANRLHWRQSGFGTKLARK